MRHFCGAMIIACCSFSALAAVTFKQKLERVESLMELQNSSKFDFSSFERALNYEKSQLPISLRIEAETQFFAEQMRTKIVEAYDKALEEHGNEGAAHAEVRNAIEKDLELASPELKEELMTFSLDTLANVKSPAQVRAELKNVSQKIKKTVVEQQQFLNAVSNDDKKAKTKDQEKTDDDNEDFVAGADPLLPSKNTSKDSERKEFKSRAEVVESLVSDRESTRWEATSNQSIRSEELLRQDTKISLQVRISFLGGELVAGPYITFSRTYKTVVVIKGEGLNPPMNLQDGNFDFYKRGVNGKPLVKNGILVRRYIAFTCEAEIEFQTDYVAGGGFTLGGPGAEVSTSKQYVSNISYDSRRIALPEYIDGKSVTMKDLYEICSKDYYKAKIPSGITIEEALNISMKNHISSLQFSHPKTKCATDDHCYEWYARNLWRSNTNLARCIQQDRREGFLECHLRGLEGENCAIFDKTGKRLSDGQFEVTCDKGLKCVQVSEGGWFKGWDLYRWPKGQCKPINRKTYVRPD